MLAVVARGLGELKGKVVFVGGAAMDFYVTDPAGEPLRPTEDVDCVIGITSRAGYRDLEEKLRVLGFAHPLDDPKAPICRWIFSGIPVDVMPTDAEVLGFSNQWYPEGISRAEKRTLPDGQEISIFSLPYFLASKIEAFLGRGKGDFNASPDMEDILVLIDRAQDLRVKVQGSPESVRAYLREKVGEFLRDDLFVESIQGHLGSRAGAGRVDKALQTLRYIAGQES